MTSPDPAPLSADLDRLLRWTGAGGEWEVVSQTASRLTLALLTCGGDEEMGRIVSDEPALRVYVEQHAQDFA